MIAEEDDPVIQRLRSQGYSISRMAREVDLNRKTFQSLLRQSTPPGE